MTPVEEAVFLVGPLFGALLQFALWVVAAFVVWFCDWLWSGNE
jgi:hypothetical protein